jgi:ABC-type lipoprotein release transport system permease subunit
MPLALALRACGTALVVAVVACAVGDAMVATVAMVCVLSVLNGFEDLVASMFNNFDPELKITPAKGKVFEPDNTAFLSIREMPEIEFCTEVLQENVIVHYHGRQEVAVAKGVSDGFQQMVNIDSLLIDGEFKLRDGDVNCAILGIGLSSALGIRTGFVDPLEIYAPVRDRRINPSNPASSFQLEYAFITGEFCVNQAVYDEKYMILPLDMLRGMLNYETEISALELKLKPQTHIKSVQQQIRSVLGDGFLVQDRYEQQEATYKMIQSEKMMGFLILAFILLIALFNVVCPVSMLMIEKQDDVRKLRSMGADDRLIRRIFLYESNMISGFGVLAGIVVGVTLCLIQQKFGIIKLGEMGTFVTNNYPVRVSPADLLLIFASVCTIGLLTSWYPVRYLGKKWLNSSRLAACLLPLFLIGCQGVRTDRPSVAATIEPQRYFAEKIAGDHFEVYTVVPAGQSPESYDPAPHEMIRIAQSKA